MAPTEQDKAALLRDYLLPATAYLADLVEKWYGRKRGDVKAIVNDAHGQLKALEGIND